MALTEHTSEEILDRYATRNTTPAEILKVQKHIAVCDSCRAKLARVINAEKAFRALHQNFTFDDVSDEPEHLPYEQLALFADNKMDDVDREITESHLAVCRECSKDLADLQIYRKIAAAPTVINTSSYETPKSSFWQRLFAFDSMGSLAPIGAVLLVAVLVGAWFLMRGNGKGEIAEFNNQNTIPANYNPTTSVIATNASPKDSPQTLPPTPTENLPDNETLYAINDGQLKIDVKNNLKGAENLSPSAQNLIRQSLQSGKIAIVNNSLGDEGGVLMGERNAERGVPFALQTPVGKVIRENQPILRWKALKDAQNYSVAIVDDKFRVVEQSGKLTATSWKPSKPLPRGVNYSWQVTATLPDGTETVSPSSPAPQARFRVIEQNLFDDINRIEKSGNRSHLALGVLYAKAGLRQEARFEFEKLVRKNPNSSLARKLLQSVK